VRGILLALASLLASFTAPVAHANPPERVPGEVLIRFHAAAAASDIQAILNDLGATRLQRFPRIRAERHRITSGSVEDAVARYRSHPSVEVIEPNWIVRADALPNDPGLDLLWGLRNSGQTGGLTGADIEAGPAWDVETGSPEIIVAILDTGADYTHPDLAANIWTNPGEIAGNRIDDDGNGFVDDVHGYDFYNRDGDPMDDTGHGTHVAGTIGAVGNNGIGITGVAWSVRLMPLKFLGLDGSGPTSAAIECVDYALGMGAHVLNNSWGGAGFSALLEIAIESANQQGVPFVAAAGNDGISLDQVAHYPASYDIPNVIAVASTTHQDIISSFSNFGATTVHLAAPGSSIWSTSPGGAYGYESGTSMAAPHVSGALALLRSEFPDMPGAQLKTVLMSSVDPLAALAGLVTSGGRLNVARMLTGFDSIPPAPVTTLEVLRVDSDRVTLRWTATGDDGVLGQASRYDLRFDTGPIDGSSFDQASAAGTMPLPGPPGTIEETTVEGLRFETTYTFALKVIDEYGNASALSNLASGRTIGPPRIVAAPGSLEMSLQTGQRGDRVILVTNTGAEGTLELAASSATPVPSGTAQLSMVLEKGASDPRVGDPVADGRGGPDGFGYRWIDSDENGGPAFEWNDITADGTPISLSGDDEMSSFVPIGFLFPFYDNLYAYVRVSTNGFLSFSSGSPDFTNQRLPSDSAPENLVAPFWDDLVFAGTSAAHAWSDGERFVVQWTNVFALGGGGPYTFQAILQADGTLSYQYLAMGQPTATSTVGIQNASRTDGLTIAFNTAYVRAGLAVRLQASPGWLSVSPPSARLAPGESVPLTVRFDASRLPGGSYEAAVRLASNDPDLPVLDVPARLLVGGAADIAFSSPILAFFQVFVGASETQAVTVTNEGFLPLEITSVRTSPPVFEVEEAPFTLGAGDSRELEVRFRPVAEGSISGILTVASNDPDEGFATIALTGTALPPPDVTVAPASLAASVLNGESVTREISIGNTGASSLRWSVVPQNDPSPEPTSLLPPSPQGGAPDGAAMSGDPALVRTDALEAELASLEGIRVLFEGAHESPGIAVWSRAVQDLERRGATVTRSATPITPELLAGYDILWVTDSQVSWEPGEVAATREWLIAGGGVLLEGDNPATLPIYNTLLDAAGAGFRYQDVRGASGITTSVYPHPTTRDVARVNLDANLATLTAIPAPATLLVEDLAGQPSAAAVVVGAGRILAFTDEVFSDYHASFADNQLLANQAFDWLSGITWLRVAPASGVTLPGGVSPVTVTMDAAGLPGGDYAARIVVASDDPDEPEIHVPVSLHVTRLPSVEAVAADVEPNTLNPVAVGRWSLARVELPEVYDPALTVPSTVRLNGVVPLAEGTGVGIGDWNGNGIPDLELRFDRTAVEALLPGGDRVPVAITGEILDVASFTGRDTVRVLRPRVTAPNGGEVLPAGSVLTIRWTEPEGWAADRADLVVSFDGGETWKLLAEGVGTGRYEWSVPHIPTTRARVRVHLYDARGPMGYDASDGAFTIQPTVSAVETEAGAAPAAYALHQNAPNPFRPETWIRFDLPSAGRVALRVYTVDGRLVREWREDLPPGRHRVRWDGKRGDGSVGASGIYFVRLTAEGERVFEASRRMMMVK
jgi:subtilisin family serine protease